MSQFPAYMMNTVNALLDWARRAGAWVLEDDYDGEFRYDGRPLAALAGLDGAGQVIYLGTFSKVLFPALRLGYLVVPEEAVDAFVHARALAGRHAPTLEQAVLAGFIAGGHFGRHIRAMRALYQERQAALVGAARAELEGLLEVAPSAAGMHLVGWLEPGTDDRAAAGRAAREGVEVRARGCPRHPGHAPSGPAPRLHRPRRGGDTRRGAAAGPGFAVLTAGPPAGVRAAGSSPPPRMHERGYIPCMPPIVPDGALWYQRSR